jgi:3,4-dihydroxy-2-butanone 4-phosphate synthase
MQHTLVLMLTANDAEAIACTGVMAVLMRHCDGCRLRNGHTGAQLGLAHLAELYY